MHKYIRAGVTDLSDEELLTRRRMAADPDTNPRILTRLADDPDSIVRTFVADNPNTPNQVYDKLKQSHLLYINAVVIIDTYEDWAYSYYDFTDDICDDFSETVVVLDGALPEYMKASWWIDASAIIDTMVDCPDRERYLRDLAGSYNPELLNAAYDVYEQYGCPDQLDLIDEDWDYSFELKIAKLCAPNLNLVKEELSVDNADRAIVIYDADEISSKVLADWLFGRVYELRLYQLDFDDIMQLDTWDDEEELYMEYGELEASEMVPYTQLRQIERSCSDAEFKNWLSKEFAVSSEYFNVYFR